MLFDHVKVLFFVCMDNKKRIILDLSKSYMKCPPDKIEYNNDLEEKKDTMITYCIHRITKKSKVVYISIPSKECYFDFYRHYLLEGKICAYCGKTECVLEKEHIIPKSCGFHMTRENKVLACAQCNRQKDNRCLGKWMFDEMNDGRVSKDEWLNKYCWISTLVARSGTFLNPLILDEWYFYFPPGFSF